MYKYKIYGLVIESEVEIMQLIKADDEDISDAVIRQESCRQEVEEYLEKKGATKKRYEIGLDYSCFENKGGFYVVSGGKEILFECREGYTPEMVTSWLTGFALSMLLLQMRILAIHCSAVSCGEKGAILIAGDPGAGKSSTTKKLLEKGLRLMADDVAALRLEDDKAVVYPAFPYQKLCRNEVENRNLDLNDLIYINEDKDKFLVPVKEEFEFSPQNLKCMVYLVVGNVDEVQVKKLTGISQLFGLKNNLFLHRLKGEWENSKEVGELCLKLAGLCPVYMIVRPANVDSQQKIADIVQGIIDQ